MQKLTKITRKLIKTRGSQQAVTTYIFQPFYSSSFDSLISNFSFVSHHQRLTLQFPNRIEFEFRFEFEFHFQLPCDALHGPREPLDREHRRRGGDSRKRRRSERDAHPLRPQLRLYLLLLRMENHSLHPRQGDHQSPRGGRRRQIGAPAGEAPLLSRVRRPRPQARAHGRASQRHRER